MRRSATLAINCAIIGRPDRFSGSASTPPPTQGRGGSRMKPLDNSQFANRIYAHERTGSHCSCETLRPRIQTDRIQGVVGIACHKRLRNPRRSREAEVLRPDRAKKEPDSRKHSGFPVFGAEIRIPIPAMRWGRAWNSYGVGSAGRRQPLFRIWASARMGMCEWYIGRHSVPTTVFFGSQCRGKRPAALRHAGTLRHRKGRANPRKGVGQRRTGKEARE